MFARIRSLIATFFPFAISLTLRIVCYSMSQKAKSNKSSRAEELRKDIPIVEHTWSTEKLLTHFNIDSSKGLTAAQVLQQRSQHGPNQLTPPKTIPGALLAISRAPRHRLPPGWMKLLHQFQNFFAILLLVGGIFCFIAYGLSSDDDTNLYLGVVLMLVVFITATFSYLQVLFVLYWYRGVHTTVFVDRKLNLRRSWKDSRT